MAIIYKAMPKKKIIKEEPKKRLDVDGKELHEGDVVENYKGHRAILNKNLEAINDWGVLHTPIKFIGVQGSGTPESPLIDLRRQPKPMWHSRNKPK